MVTSMMSSVPQFIDIEDKIAGPLTWRQLLWMIGMGVLLLVVYNMVGGAGFIVLAVPIVLVFSALAFYRPQGQPLISFVGHGFFFLFRPKVAVWERPVIRPQAVAPMKKNSLTTEANETKGVSRERLRALAQILDQGV